jgi:putative colanic acid biosynthesis acetyltransferase WcaB
MGNLVRDLFQDWEANREGNAKSRLVMIMFRSAQILGKLPAPFSILFGIYRIVYLVIVEWILGVELPWDTQVGSGLKLLHGVGSVINHEVVIGKGCTLRHATTIGNKQLSDGSVSGSPQIGNFVDIGSNVVIIGPISVGDHAVIGAGSVVVKDVPERAVVAGNPARVIRMIKPVPLSESEPKSVISQLNLVDNSSDVAHISQ